MPSFGRWGYNPTRLGLVPDGRIGVDLALGDIVLSTALQATRRGDWKGVAWAMAETAGDWDRRHLLVSLVAEDAVTRDGWLKEWQQAEPGSPDAAVLRAASLAAKADGVRGDRPAHRTPELLLAEFQWLCHEAAAAAEAAAELAPADPTPWVTRIVAAKGQRLPHEQFHEIWEGLVARAPLHRGGHTHAYKYWGRKWFGSDAIAADFVSRETAVAPDSAMAFELRLHDVIERGVSQSISMSEYFRAGAGRRPLDEALDAFWTGTVPEGTGVATIDQNLLAWALTQTERYDDACQVWRKLEGRQCAGYPWLYYIDSGTAAFRALRQRAFESATNKHVA